MWKHSPENLFIEQREVLGEATNLMDMAGL